MSNYAHIVNNVVDNIIVCEDSNISLFPGTYIKVTELTGEAKNGGFYNPEKINLLIHNHTSLGL